MWVSLCKRDTKMSQIGSLIMELAIYRQSCLYVSYVISAQPIIMMYACLAMKTLKPSLLNWNIFLTSFIKPTSAKKD